LLRRAALSLIDPLRRIPAPMTDTGHGAKVSAGAMSGFDSTRRPIHQERSRFFEALEQQADRLLTC
jgi:hypothetical protein